MIQRQRAVSFQAMQRQTASSIRGDGHPGATVIVDVPVLGELEIYIAQRTHQSLHGRLTDDGTLEGGIHGHALDQETLDATSALMKVSPVMRPDPDRSAWWMVTVPEDTTCETLASRACGARHGHRMSGWSGIRAAW